MGRHLKICVFDSRAKSVNAGRVEGFASHAMELDVVSLLEANDGHLGVAITLYHQSLIGMQRKNRKGAAPVKIKGAPQLARGDLDSLNLNSERFKKSLQFPSRPKRLALGSETTFLKWWLIFQFMQSLHSAIIPDFLANWYGTKFCDRFASPITRRIGWS